MKSSSMTTTSTNPFNNKKTYKIRATGLDMFHITQLIAGIKQSESTANLYRTSEIVWLDQSELLSLVNAWKVKEATRLIKSIAVREEKVKTIEGHRSNWECVNRHTQEIKLKSRAVNRISVHNQALSVKRELYKQLKLTTGQIIVACQSAGAWWECYLYDENI